MVEMVKRAKVLVTEYESGKGILSGSEYRDLIDLLFDYDHDCLYENTTESRLLESILKANLFEEVK